MITSYTLASVSILDTQYSIPFAAVLELELLSLQK